MPFPYHGDILAQYKETISDRVDVEGTNKYKKLSNNFINNLLTGGGIVRIDRTNKTLKTFGKSGGFGKPDQQVLEQVLQNTVGQQGYQLTITITDEIRG